MIQVLEFWVPGAPKTKGSLTARMVKCRCTTSCNGYRGSPQLRDSEGSKRWRKLVAYQAEAAKVGGATRFGHTGWPLTGWIALEITYGLDAGDVLVQGAGDLDKLDRNVFDALQDAQVIENDAQVARCLSEKLPADMVSIDRSPGALIKVMVLGE